MQCNWLLNRLSTRPELKTCVYDSPYYYERTFLIGGGGGGGMIDGEDPHPRPRSPSLDLVVSPPPPQEDLRPA